MTKTFDVVLAADLRWGIGLDGKLPWPHLRADMRHFKRVTTGQLSGTATNAVIMGRRTWESIARPLPERVNVVVTSRVPPAEVVMVASSLDEALAVEAEGRFVIGGGELYREALRHPDLRHIYLTQVLATFKSDVRVPPLFADFEVDQELPQEPDARTPTAAEARGFDLRFLRLRRKVLV